MPVGTKATVKGVDVERLGEIGAQIILCNTYHLWLRPGEELIARMGGVHRFSSWQGPMLSDSGGYQVFSLKGLRNIKEEGVEFRSHLDGSLQFLSPERSIQIQETLGVDIAMAFDECPPAQLGIDEARLSLERTIRWEKRTLEARRNPERTALFGITQGALHPELRTIAAAELSKLPFNGFAIGGLSVGETRDEMYEVLSWHPAQLPQDKIRYLMGVGTPEDIVEAVSRGVDLFDCVMPTRAGRFGRAFISGEEPWVNVKNARFSEDQRPLDESCGCIACRRYSRAYLNHLFKVSEMLGPQLVSVHNLTHYLSLMSRIRRSIEEQTFDALHAAERARWKNFRDDS